MRNAEGPACGGPFCLHDHVGKLTSTPTRSR
jgi:hypothetical protein